MKRLIAASVATAFLATSFLSGCASPSGNIAPSYVSSFAYQGVSCRQLAAEEQLWARTVLLVNRLLEHEP